MTKRFANGWLLIRAMTVHALPSNDQVEASSQREIQPLLENCGANCHGPALQTGRIGLRNNADHASVVRARPVWLPTLPVLRDRVFIGPCRSRSRWEPRAMWSMH